MKDKGVMIMEKYFTVSEDSSYFKDLMKCEDLEDIQRKHVKKFCEEHGITAKRYRISGTGIMNVPFKERNKKDIRLSIVPTPEDIEKFEKQLKVPMDNNLRTFKANSAVGKAFAQSCIDENIVINLRHPQIGDLFQSVRYQGASSTYFRHDGKNYLKVSSDYLKDDDVPEGVTEIKGSEFELAREALLEKTA